jgi:hypothetical protein
MALSIRVLLLVVCCQMGAARCMAQHLDVLPQTTNGKIVIGAANYDNNTWTIGKRVFERQLLSNFRANDPGFTGLETGNPLLESGVSGFPANHDVYFDLLPMRVGSVRSNLFFWNGSDLGGNGLSLDDVQFGLPPVGVTWNIFDDGFNVFTAAAIDSFVSGGRVQKTSSDINPGDGIDTGSLHNHLLIRVDDGDGNTQTLPPQGVYMVALQLRAAGFETSDPFLFVHRTSNLSNQVRDLAAEWADLNFESMFALPGDFDSDGDVDGRDFLVWQRDTNIGNLSDWQTNYGSSDGSTLISQQFAVPEPTASGLILMTATFMFSYSGRSRRQVLQPITKDSSNKGHEL